MSLPLSRVNLTQSNRESNLWVQRRMNSRISSVDPTISRWRGWGINQELECNSLESVYFGDIP